jgi:hypothetical protein
VNITGLTQGQTYYVRAYAINNVSVAYGQSKTFKLLTQADWSAKGIVLLEAEELMVIKQDGGSTSNPGTAFSTCSGVTNGGYSDWRLPSLGELSTLYQNQSIIGGFNGGSYYWSSDVCDTYNNYLTSLDFADGSTQCHNRYDYTPRIRCVRSLP